MAILILGAVAALLLAILAIAALAGWIAKKRGGSKFGWRVFALALLIGYGVPAAKIFIDRRAYDVACERDTGVFIYKVAPGVKGYFIEGQNQLPSGQLERPRRFEFVEGMHSEKPWAKGDPRWAPQLSRLTRGSDGKSIVVPIRKDEMLSEFGWRIRYEGRHGVSHGFGYRITEVFRISDGEVIAKTISVVSGSNLETGSWKIWQLRGPCIELRGFPARTDFVTHVFPESES
jgi:hypothetical protein